MAENTEKKTYEAPELVAYGSIEDITLLLPGGNIKGGGGPIHLDKFGEESGIDVNDFS